MQLLKNYRKRGRAAWLAVSMLVLCASAAQAAPEVVEVRVGDHPTFTRVVFELNGAAGYAIERRLLDDGSREIVVTLDATSVSRDIASRSAMVQRVSVDPARERAVAHIQLRKAPSRVKEMLLSQPPRLVFDVMLPESDLAAIAAAKKQAVEKPAPVVAPAPVKVAKAEPKPAVKKVAAPEPKPVVKQATAPAPKPAVTKVAAPEPKPVVKQATAPEPKPSAEVAPTPPAAKAPPVPVEPAKKFAQSAKTAAPPEAPRSAPSSGGSFDWMTWGSAGAGVLVLLIGVVLYARRRALPNDMDVTALAEREGIGGDPSEGFAMGESASDDSELPVPRSELSNDRDRVESSASDSPGIAAGPGLFDDEDEEKGEGLMDTENPQLPMDRTASELPTQLGGAAAGGDIARLVQELDRRVAQLETRLDETVDSRERLERQVAAQSEELRVQRAAIARTQRALRSLTRTEEEQATEPALRDPDQTA